jgi:hypothetical protein
LTDNRKALAQAPATMASFDKGQPVNPQDVEYITEIRNRLEVGFQDDEQEELRMFVTNTMEELTPKVLQYSAVQ